MGSLSADDFTDVPDNIVNGTHPELIAYLVLNIWPSHFGLPALIAVILCSKKIKRHPTFLNFLFLWIIVGISSVLLLYAGKTTGPEPPKMLCLFQASLIYSIPPMTSAAACALVVQMFLAIRGAYYGREVKDQNHILRTWALLAVPYLALFIFGIATAVVGSWHPEKISRNRRFFYCSVEWDPLTNALSLVAAVNLLTTVVLEVWTVVILYKLQLALSKQGSSIWHAMDLNFPIRIICFGFYLMLALFLSLQSITTPRSPIPDLIIATAASVFILIFGTQRDIVRALCFWRRTDDVPEQPPLPQPQISIFPRRPLLD